MSEGGVTPTGHIVEAYRSAFREHGRSPASVLCPKGRQGLRFDALLARLNVNGKSLLDFGCGLGHLCDHLSKRDIACQYLGVDIVADFIESDRVAYPDRDFRQIAQIGDIAGRFDIVLASGVFNIRYLEDEKKNLAFVQQRISELFALCDEALTIDFMTSHVDFSRDEAFHADPSAMLEFAVTHLSRRAVIDHSYMPYEFCMTVFRQDAIDRAGSVYA
jgi:cyclopropane fatty-acyl-phospholipid synthase-like methyltransferase